MRISNKLFQDQSINALLDRQVKLSKTELQLATGRRVLTPADDPVSSALALSLRETQQITEQHQLNAEAAKARLGIEDETLAGAVNLLQRIRELAVQATSDTYSPADRQAIALEVRERLNELVGLANTKDANGEYIFAGYQGTTRPFNETAPGVFAYAGDDGQRELQIGPERRIAVGDSGLDVFMDVQTGAGTTQDIFTTISNFTDATNTNTQTNAVLADLDLGLENFLNTQAKIGTRLNAIDSQKEVNEGANVQLQQTLSNLEDLDYAKAVSDLNLDLVGLEAAQQAYIRVQNLSLFNFL